MEDGRSHHNSEVNLLDANSDEICALLQIQKSMIEITCLENHMFERQMKRLQIPTEVMDDTCDSLSLSSTHRRSRIRSRVPERYLKLSAAQKCTMAQTEIDEMKKEMIAMEQRYQNLMGDLKASLESMSITLKEFDNSHYAFSKNVVALIGADKLDFSKIARFHDRYMKKMNGQLANFRIENLKFKARRREQIEQLIQLEERSESVTNTDVEELRICCRRAANELNRMDALCLESKARASQVLLRLRRLRKQHAKAMRISEDLAAETKERCTLLNITRSQVPKAKKERKDEVKQNIKLSQLLGTYKVPPISNFIENIKELEKLKKQRSVVLRRNNLSKLQLDQYRKIWAQLKRSYADDGRS